MLRKYVHVDENNVAIQPLYVHGEVDAPISTIAHDSPEDVEIGSMWNGSAWVQTDALVREKRDAKLASEVDPIAGNTLRWAALSAAKQAEWADYRQALLDVPQQSGFPMSVAWPTKPA